ncbi:MAG: ABC transporter substrate-binding protein [Nodosilinea sp.]
MSFWPRPQVYAIPPLRPQILPPGHLPPAIKVGKALAVTRREAQTLTHHTAWSALKAVRQGHVYLVDGNQYFNRPGPRLVESLEILAEIFHPEVFGTGRRRLGWEPWRCHEPDHDEQL